MFSGVTFLLYWYIVRNIPGIFLLCLSAIIYCGVAFHLHCFVCLHIVVAILNMVRDEGVSFWLQELLLASLHWCFQVDTVQGLQCGAISSAVSLLSHPSSLVRGRAATLIYDLTTPYQGKEEACDLPGCVESLVSLLSDQDSFVRAQTAAALMRSAPPCLTVHYQKHICSVFTYVKEFLVDVSLFIMYNPGIIFSSMAVITKGKYAVLEAGALPHLISLFTDSSSEVRTNAVKVCLSLLTALPSYHLHYNSTIHYYSHLYYHYHHTYILQTVTMLAETPRGKQELQSVLSQVCMLPLMSVGCVMTVCNVCTM